MAFTSLSPLFAAVHEDGINALIRQLMHRNPTLFNYGSDAFVARPELLCNDIAVWPPLRSSGAKVVKRMQPLPIPGNDQYGLEWGMQITDLQIDFHKGSVLSLPPQLPQPLPEQHLAIKASACFALGCPGDRALIAQPPNFPPIDVGTPDKHELERRRREEEERRRREAATGDDRDKGLVKELVPLLPQDKVCACLDMYAVAHVRRIDNGTVSLVDVVLDRLEIVDITPDGLESLLECYASTALRWGVLPRMRLAFHTLSLTLPLQLGMINVTPTTTVPHNPAIEDDQLKLFLDVDIAGVNP
jgi:hypothetical protein